MMDGARKVAGYVRVSQERAAKNGYGLGAQEQEVRRFVEYKAWTLVDLYREERGYQRTDYGTIAVVPEEAVMVERIFRWAAEGLSLPAIAKALRDDKTATRNGGAWRPSTIRGMLRNRFYTGRVEFDGAVIRARHDAILSDALFLKANPEA